MIECTDNYKQGFIDFAYKMRSNLHLDCWEPSSFSDQDAGSLRTRWANVEAPESSLESRSASLH
jgi:hypothetical protein